MVRVLEGSRVLNDEKGDLVRLYYSNGEMEDYHIPHLYAIRIENSKCTETVGKLRRKGFDVRVYGSGDYHRALHIEVPREQRKDVYEIDDKLFNKAHRYSTEDMVRMRFPAYSLIEIEGGRPKVVGTAKPEDIMRSPQIAAIDIEKRKKNSKEYNEIVMNAIATDKGTTCIVLSEFGVDKVPDYLVVNRNSEMEIAKTTSRMLRKKSIAAHNLPFDFGELREASGEMTFASPDEYAANIKRIGDFLKIVKLRGKKILDTCSFSRNYLPLVRDNLESVYNYYFPKGYEKLLDYGEMDKLFAKAADGKDPESAKITVKYNAEDAEKCLDLANKMMSIAAPCMIALKTDASSFFQTSISELAKKRREIQYFYELNACRGDRKTDLNDFDMNAEKMDFLKNNGMSISKAEGMIGPTVIVYPTHVLNTMPRIKDENIGKLYELTKSGDPKDRVVVAQVLDALSEEPFLDMLRCIDPKKYYYKLRGEEHLESIDEKSRKKAENSFTWSYGENPSKVHEALKLHVKDSAQLLKANNLTAMNSAGRFLFLSNGDYSELEDARYFIPYAVSDWTLAMGNAVIAKVGKTVMGFEADSVGKHGMRCEFEKKLLASYFETFPDRKEMSREIEHAKYMLKANLIPKEDLAYRMRKGDKPSSIQVKTGKRETMKRDIDMEMKTTAYSVWCDVGGRIIGKRLEDVEQSEIAIEKYYDEIFGEKGTITRFSKIGAQSSISGWF